MGFQLAFRRTTWLAVSLLAALPHLAEAQAQVAQQAALGETIKTDAAKVDVTRSDPAKSVPAQPTVGIARDDKAGADPSQPKSITTRTIEKVTEAAKSAGDIFSRVPCHPPKGVSRSMGSLPVSYTHLTLPTNREV